MLDPKPENLASSTAHCILAGNHSSLARHFYDEGHISKVALHQGLCRLDSCEATGTGDHTCHGEVSRFFFNSLEFKMFVFISYIVVVAERHDLDGMALYKSGYYFVIVMMQCLKLDIELPCY